MISTFDFEVVNLLKVEKINSYMDKRQSEDLWFFVPKKKKKRSRKDSEFSAMLDDELAKV